MEVEQGHFQLSVKLTESVRYSLRNDFIPLYSAGSGHQTLHGAS